MSANHALAKVKTRLVESSNMARELKWVQSDLYRYTAIVQQLTPLVNFLRREADVETATLTIDRLELQLQEQFQRTMDQLLDCNPTSMGMGNEDESVAAFKALQIEGKVLRQLVQGIRHARKDGSASWLQHMLVY